MKKIKCDVVECKYCDCECHECELEQIKVCGCDCDNCSCKENTMCNSFKCRKD